MRQLVIDISDETVRARYGAMSSITGGISFKPRLPSPGQFLKSLVNHESRIRPYYSGSGTIMLQPSLSGYHYFDVENGDDWLLEPGVYWASEGSVALGLFRERMGPSILSGDGWLVWKTRIKGHGQVAIRAPGPVEMIDVNDTEFRVQGRLVLGRTSGLRFNSRRSAPFPRNLISGQSRLRVYSGTGKVLFCWTPYWNQHMYNRMTGESIDRSLFE